MRWGRWLGWLGFGQVLLCCTGNSNMFQPAPHKKSQGPGAGSELTLWTSVPLATVPSIRDLNPNQIYLNKPDQQSRTKQNITHPPPPHPPPPQPYGSRYITLHTLIYIKAYHQIPFGSLWGITKNRLVSCCCYAILPGKGGRGIKELRGYSLERG